jgi:ArsR family transcriptional regulator, arsenate/arsenite/antimonite-responsive transcriptional repressor
MKKELSIFVQYSTQHIPQHTMAYSNHTIFEEQAVRIAAVAKALSHPARVQILAVLAEEKTCICGDIVDKLPLSQSTVSQHLSELKSAGLIKGTIDGPKVCYCLDVQGLAEAQTLLGGALQTLHQHSAEIDAQYCS